MEDYIEANRENWNERTAIHAKSEYYDVEGFKAGKSTLKSIELEELGDVAGKSLLHIQCHFGLDTLSWARLGGRVTGVDFSDRAIALARSLSRELGIPADFVLSNVYDLPDVLDEKVDIVFTSYGVLCWLPDLAKWAEVVAQYVRPGGTFYMVDGHPMRSVFWNPDAETDLRVRYPYFHSPEPERDEPYEWGTYTDPVPLLATPNYQWLHSLGDVVNSLISAGMKIEFLNEFPFDVYESLPGMEQGEDGWWRLKEHSGSIPLLLSIRATKPG